MRRVSIYAPKQTQCLPYARYDHERPGEATSALRGRVCRAMALRASPARGAG